MSQPIETRQLHAGIPSFARPKNVKRQQPPLLERVREFVEAFGSDSDANRGLPAGYYVQQALASATLSQGVPSQGYVTSGTKRRKQEEANILSRLRGGGRPTSSGGLGAAHGGLSAQSDRVIRQMRERMHRSTQGLPTVPLPDKILEKFASKDPNPEGLPEAAEAQALTWLGLRRVERCGLCETSFPKDSLSTSVSRKAIDNLRDSWLCKRNAKAAQLFLDHEHRLSNPAHVYKAVRVCRFCAQFFGVFLGSKFEEDEPRKRLPKTRASNTGGRPGTGSTPADTKEGDTGADDDSSEESYSEDDDVSSSQSDEAPEGTAVANATSAESPSPHSASPVSSSSRSSSVSSETSVTHCGAPPAAGVSSSHREAAHVRALDQPAHPVATNRSSLLRRMHHQYRKELQQEMAAAAEATEASLAPAPLPHQHDVKKNGKQIQVVVPIAESFVLGPSSSDESAEHNQKAQRSEEGGATRTPIVTAPGASFPDDDVLSSSAASGGTSGERPKHAEWSGAVKVLIIACQEYRQRVALPSAVISMAKRLGHWCEQLFGGMHEREEEASSVASLLINDDATFAAVGAFFDLCSVHRAAPLIFFLGHASHLEEAFGDAALFFTATVDSEAQAPPPRWPPAIEQLLNHSSVTLPAAGHTTTTNPTSSSTRKKPTGKKSNQRHDENLTFNPFLSSPSSGSGRNAVLSMSSVAKQRDEPFMLVSELDDICRALALPNPVLVVDSGFGPLVASLHSLTMVHPTSANQRVGERGSLRVLPVAARLEPKLAPAIPLGVVIQEFVELIAVTVSDGARATNWQYVVESLRLEADAGATTQRLFHQHIADDKRHEYILVTAPSSSRTVVVRRRLPEIRLPRESTSVALWFPAGSMPIEMHLNSATPSSSSGDMSSVEELLRNTAKLVSVSLALRLHPRHTVPRMCGIPQRAALAKALQDLFLAYAPASVVNSLLFNMMVALSGHVTVFVSSQDQQTVHAAAQVVAQHVEELLSKGWCILDFGFVVAGTPIDAAVTLDPKALLTGPVVYLDVQS